jgi:hypothetical protein
MTQTAKGRLIGLAALGMMLTLLAPEMPGLGSFREVLTPVFLGKVMGHLGVVIAAYVGGTIVPTRGE